MQLELPDMIPHRARDAYSHCTEIGYWQISVLVTDLGPYHPSGAGSVSQHCVFYW